MSKTRALEATAAAINEVLEDFPPMGADGVVIGAVSLHLGEAGIDHRIPDEFDLEYLSSRPGLVAVCSDYEIFWNGIDADGITIKDK